MQGENLLSLSEDLCHFISMFLSSKELVYLMRVNKFFGLCCFIEDKYWLLRLVTLVVPVHMSRDLASAPDLRAQAGRMRSLLRAPTYFCLYRCLRHFNFSLLGLWSYEPQSTVADFRGGLLRVRVRESVCGVPEAGVIAETLTPHGVPVHPCFSLHAESRGRLIAVGDIDKVVYNVKRCSSKELVDRLIFVENKNLVKLCFQSLTPSSRPPFSQLSCSQPSNHADLHPRDVSTLTPAAILLGLYRARYGPHGQETLVVHTKYTTLENESTVTGRRGLGLWTIFGDKVSGDANVPAQQTSFQFFSPTILPSSVETTPLITENCSSRAGKNHCEDVEFRVNSECESEEEDDDDQRARWRRLLANTPLEDLRTVPSLHVSAQQIAAEKLNWLLRSTFFHVTDDGEHELLTFQAGDPLEGGLPHATVTRRPACCVRTVLTGRGQINRTAGEWAPEWIPACLVLYYPQNLRVTTRHGYRPVAFSVVFMSNDREPLGLGGHIMDFFSVSDVSLHYGWNCRSASASAERAPEDVEEDSSVEDYLHAFIGSLGVY